MILFRVYCLLDGIGFVDGGNGFWFNIISIRNSKIIISCYKLDVRCNVCGLSFKTVYRLNKHICRLDVENSKFSEYYIRNWTVAKGCTQLFSSTKKIEIAILHSKMCLGGKNICAKRTCENTVIHLESEKYLKKGKINWQALSLNLEE